jgi:hypothetical protein
MAKLHANRACLLTPYPLPLISLVYHHNCWRARSQQNASDASDIFNVPLEFGQLRNAATELTDLVTQVARSGNTVRMNRVRELLEQVKRDIHAMLSEQ